MHVMPLVQAKRAVNTASLWLVVFHPNGSNSISHPPHSSDTATLAVLPGRGPLCFSPCISGGL